MQDPTFMLDAELNRYVREHTDPIDPIDRELIEVTDAMPMSSMQTPPEQARFLGMMVQAMQARLVLEIGTFTGLSALAMARALPPEGRLLACDVSEQWTSIARDFWERADVADKIDLRLGPALDTLRGLPADTIVDLAFIDADKGGYVDYLDAIVPLVRPGGLILADNVLWDGTVADADTADAVALRRFNDAAVARPDLETVMLPVFDGLTMCVKRP